MSKKHPMQRVIAVNGVHRFEENAIVSHLLEFASKHGCDMNTLACMEFSDEDSMQFAQLIGYSVSGYGDLSYVSNKSYYRAAKASKKLLADGAQPGPALPAEMA